MKREHPFSACRTLLTAGVLSLAAVSTPLLAEVATIQFNVPPSVPADSQADLLFANPDSATDVSSRSVTIKALTEEQEEKYQKMVLSSVQPEKNLDLILGQNQVLVFDQAPRTVQLVNDRVAELTIISPQEVSIKALEVGTTTLNVWFSNPEAENGFDVLSYLVRCFPDPNEKDRLVSIYQVLERDLNDLFPDSDISLHLIGEKVVVKGKAESFIEAAQIIRIIHTQSKSPAGADIPSDTGLGVNFTNPDVADLPAIRNYLISGSSNIVNMLQVPPEKQVMLRVTVAEVNRSAARSIGFNFNLLNPNGFLEFGNTTGGLLNQTGSAGGGNIPITYVDNVTFQAALRALRTMSMGKTLAEPTLVTLNGKAASFRTGGSFPIPVVTGNTSSGLQGVTFQEFGVDLSFTPFTVTEDKIRLLIDGKVSSRDNGGGGQIGATTVPGLDERTFNTTVEMNEGQTLAIAGILQTETRSQSRNIPLLGDLPLIGRFFGNSEITSSEQELVVLVTPEVVSALEYNEVPPLPGDDSFEPDDLEFYLYGRMESRAPRDFRSPVQNDFDRLRWHRVEQVYLNGPSGYSTGGNYPY
ncbi:MAG: pilus assembly protein N-terminal domain-containing protein [Candidatus Sumerlaeia bacterium]|nr:pilus assembly protein N-terminal domain-containing protein [Candidatus Sumerlaeia bacterium]